MRRFRKFWTYRCKKAQKPSWKEYAKSFYHLRLLVVVSVVNRFWKILISIYFVTRWNILFMVRIWNIYLYCLSSWWFLIYEMIFLTYYVELLSRHVVSNEFLTDTMPNWALKDPLTDVTRAPQIFLKFHRFPMQFFF